MNTSKDELIIICFLCMPNVMNYIKTMQLRGFGGQRDYSVYLKHTREVWGHDPPENIGSLRSVLGPCESLFFHASIQYNF